MAMYDIIMNSEAEVLATVVQSAVVETIQSEEIGNELSFDVNFTPQVKGKEFPTFSSMEFHKAFSIS